MDTKKHSVEDLFSDNGPFDEAEVVKAIQPLITIQKSTHDIFLKNSSANAESQILAYGLAKKLLRMKKLIENEMITALELHKKTGIKKGTIDPTFKRLKDEGYIVGKGEYEIQISKISKIIELLNKYR